MKNEVIYTNGYINLEWEYIRLIVTDSDRNYIDYLFDGSFTEPKRQEEIIEVIEDEFNEKDDFKSAKLCLCLFDACKVIPFSSKEELKNIRDEYGKEWVNRIGGYALITKE